MGNENRENGIQNKILIHSQSVDVDCTIANICQKLAKKECLNMFASGISWRPVVLHSIKCMSCVLSTKCQLDIEISAFRSICSHRNECFRRHGMRYATHTHTHAKVDNRHLYLVCMFVWRMPKLRVYKVVYYYYSNNSGSTVHDIHHAHQPPV